MAQVEKPEGVLISFKTWFSGMSFGRLLVGATDSLSLTGGELNAGAASKLLTEMANGKEIRETTAANILRCK